MGGHQSSFGSSIESALFSLLTENEPLLCAQSLALAFDGVHKGEIAHGPGEEGAFGVAGAAEEERSGGEIDDTGDAELPHQEARRKLQCDGVRNPR